MKIFYLIFIFSLNSVVMAQEGVITELTSNDVAEFITASNNSKKILSDTEYDLSQVKFEARRDFLASGIQKAVRVSGKREFQSYMRYALNRGLLLQKTLASEADEKVPGNIQNQISVLTIALKIGLMLYESDVEFANRVRIQVTPSRMSQAELGLIFATKFLDLSRNTFDATAQYKLTRKTFEFLSWDLTQDLKASFFAEDILDIQNVLTKFTEFLVDDKEAILYLREFRRLEEITLPSLINKLAQESLYFQNILQKNRRKKELHAQGICGVEGSVEERILDCRVFADSIQDQFVLVIRDQSKNIEILKDTKTKKLWFKLNDIRGGHDQALKYCFSLSRDIYGMKFFWLLPKTQDYRDIYEFGSKIFGDTTKAWWALEGDGHIYYHKAFSSRRGIVGGKFYKDVYGVQCINSERSL